MDWNLARTRKAIDSELAWSASDRTEMYGQPGGAALTARLMPRWRDADGPGDLRRRLARGAPDEPMTPADTRLHHSYAVWSKFPRKKGDRDSSIWRVEEFLGLDRGRTTDAADGADGAAQPTDRPLQTS